MSFTGDRCEGIIRTSFTCGLQGDCLHHAPAGRLFTRKSYAKILGGKKDNLLPSFVELLTDVEVFIIAV